MKRILAMLCVIACLFALAVPALAADTVTVHAYVPEGWSDVRVWAWDDSDKNPTSAAWPGDLVMTKGADGWYTVEVPYGYANMLINANGGAAQTDDIKGIDLSKEIWIVCGDRSHEFYTSKPANVNVGGGNNGGDSGNAGGSGIDVSALNSMALVGTGIPGVGEWNPGDAAGDMTKVSNGVFSKVIAVTAGTAMQFKMAANDSWDGGANLGAAEEGVVVALGQKVDLINDGGSKDLSFTASKDCNLKFTVTIVDGAASLVVEETDEEPSTNPGGSTGAPIVPDGEGITVYARVPASWSVVLLWAWDDNDNNVVPGASWPGNLVMTKGDDGWYSVRIPLGYTNMLVTNGSGEQCTDLKGLEAGKDIYIDALTDLNNPVAYYEKVEIEEPDPNATPSAPSRPLVPPTDVPDNNGSDNTANNDNNATENASGDDLTVVLAIVGAVVIAAAAAVVIIIAKKKQA